MALVGDLILELRSRIPDAPPVMNLPTIGTLTETPMPNAFIAGQTVYIAATSTTAWGETSPTQLVSIPITGPNAVIVEIWTPGNTSATGTNLYWGLDPYLSNLNRYTGNQDPQNLVLFPPGQGTLPPTRSTAFLPDADGNFIGGYMVYRLLNRALSELVKICGGIIDVTGVRTTINQSMYRMDSPFYGFVNAWFDGYPMDVVPRSFMYLRNSAAGFSGILSYEQDGPQQVVQVWPQSNRTGGSSVLAADLDEKANSFQIQDPIGFLAIGLAKIDDEVVVYSSVTDQNFSGVTRGMGGTEIAYHLAGAPVEELNLRMSGYRMARTYNVGDSGLTLMVPQSWETPLVLHMLSQVRSMEQDDATAQKLLSDFQAQADKISKQSRLGKLKPRQIPIWGQNVSDARNINGVGFGWLIN